MMQVSSPYTDEEENWNSYIDQVDHDHRTHGRHIRQVTDKYLRQDRSTGFTKRQFMYMMVAELYSRTRMKSSFGVCKKTL